MAEITLFVLGQKGYAAASACLSEKYCHLIKLVVIGEDKNLRDDWSSNIRTLCESSCINFVMRSSYTANDICANSIAIASGWRWLINENFNKLIVLHDSILPKYRGFNPLVTSLLNRDRVIGATAFIANGDFDTGPIIDSELSQISYPIKISSAMNTIESVIYKLTLKLLNRIANHESLIGTPQDETHVSYSVWRDSNDYWIDWAKSSEDISHFINCVSTPYAGASTLMDGELIRIIDATPIDDVTISNRDPGKVLFIKNLKPIVICGNGLLRIDQAVNENGITILPLQRFRIRFKSLII